ncbi:MAG: hypothetical protein JSV51_02055, partial [Candidatus Bathyarchaeota archaeon]
MIVVFEVIYAIISAILILLGFITLRAIKHLGVGKPFWIPVIASSIFFLIGSLATVLYELGFSILVQTAEIVQIIRIAALCILVCGIYSYSRRIKTSLREDFPTSQQKIKEMFEAEALSKEASHIDTSSPERIVHENTMHKSKE